MNELINELYAKIDNQEKIIRELQEEIERQSKAQVILDNQNSELYRALLDIKEDLITMYNDTPEISKIDFEFYLEQLDYLLKKVNKAIGSDKEC